MDSTTRSIRDRVAATIAARKAKGKPRTVEASYKVNRIGKPLGPSHAIQHGSMPPGKRAPGCTTSKGKWHGIAAQLGNGTLKVGDLDWQDSGRYRVEGLETDNLIHAYGYALYVQGECIDQGA